MRCLFFMQLISVELHYVEIALADIEQLRNIFFTDDVTPPKRRPLMLSRYDLSDIMGEWKSHGFFNWYDFEHYRTPSKPPLEVRAILPRGIVVVQPSCV